MLDPSAPASRAEPRPRVTAGRARPRIGESIVTAAITGVMVASVSGCVLLPGPADAVLRVSGEVAGTGSCSIRMLALPSGEPMSTRRVTGRFETSFTYYATARPEAVRFERACAGSAWVAFGNVVRLDAPRPGGIDLGRILP